MFTELRSKLSPPRGRAGAVRAGFGERRDVDGSVHLQTPCTASIHSFIHSFIHNECGVPLCNQTWIKTPASPDSATAHFSFCRTLLEHTVSAESIPCHLPRTPGTSLTWHD
ncbi:SAMD10 isoform 4, partial [Pongo abelii]